MQELNDWHVKMSSEAFSPYLSDSEVKDIHGIKKGIGFVEVTQSGWLDVKSFLTASRDYFLGSNRFVQSGFDDKAVDLTEKSVVYDNQAYQSIVLCRGYKELTDSRFFPHIPFNPAKGQTLTLSVPELQLDSPLHAGVFILPLGNHLFRVGSTYSWADFNETPENDKRDELLEKFREVCSLDLELVEEKAGVRPATKDRRPIVGYSSIDERVMIFNGMGSRAVMMAPHLADELHQHMTGQSKLSSEIDVSRYA